MPKLQFGDDAYRIVGDTGEEGDLAEYGEAATLDTVLGRLVAIVDKEGLDVVSLLPGDEWMIRGDAVTCEQEDVQFDVAGEVEEEAAAVELDEDEDEDEEDDDEGEDGDEDGEDGDEDEEEVEELKA